MEILSFCEIKPASNQIELHPYLVLESVHEFHHKLGIPLEAYSPLNPQLNPFTKESMKNYVLLNEPLINDLAKKYNRTAGQIVLNWHV